MIQLVATDLDGTVVRPDGTISARTRSALAAVEDQGRRLVFVTGRPPRWMRDIAEQTGHRGVAICANGACVYDLHTEQVVEQFSLSVQTMLDAVTRLRRVMPGVAFGLETLDGFGHEPGYNPRWDPGRSVTVGPIEELLAGPAAKLLARDETLTGDAMLALARPALDGAADVTHSNADDCLVEISAHGVTKATTLARLADRWGVPAQAVLAFGDMPNDVAMLQWAGLGYAMANAHPEVLAAAPQVAPSVLDDGVAVVIERLLLAV